LACVNYSLIFLFRSREHNSSYFLKKQIAQTVTLRSPKHFNIGKYKIFNLNYKVIDLNVSKGFKFHLNALTNTGSYFFRKLSTPIQSSPVLRVNSIKLSVSTKFKLKWLEI
jgi:hypothetical protein